MAKFCLRSCQHATRGRLARPTLNCSSAAYKLSKLDWAILGFNVERVQLAEHFQRLDSSKYHLLLATADKRLRLNSKRDMEFEYASCNF